MAKNAIVHKIRITKIRYRYIIYRNTILHLYVFSIKSYAMITSSTSENYLFIIWNIIEKNRMTDKIHGWRIVFSEQYKTLKNSEKYRFHKRSWDWHAWLSLREEVYKCDLKFYITHEQVFNVITFAQFVNE